MTTASSSRYPTLLLYVGAIWFLISVAVSAAGGLQPADQTQPPLALLFVLVPPLGLAAWCAVSPGLRAFVRAIDLRAIVSAQVFRLIGVVFLVLYAQGALPGSFALPAGWGDVTIGLTAPLVALIAGAGRGRLASLVVVIWTLLGLADLVSAVTLGTLNGPSRLGLLYVAGGPSMAPVLRVPLSLIPTFGVPFAIILHGLTLWRLRATPESGPEWFASASARPATP